MKKILFVLIALGVFSGGQAAPLGDYAPGANICGKFTTYQPSTGAAFALAGTPALAVYKDNSTTESTAGVTLTASFDSRTGLNHYCVDTSADGTFYSANSNFDVVITTGTVDGVSVVGSAVASFSLNKVAALRPTTAGRPLDVSAGGEAGIDWANIGSPTTTVALTGTTISTTQAIASVTGPVGSIGTGGITEASFATTTGSIDALGISRQGTAQAATSTTITLDASAPFATGTILGSTLWVRGSTNGNYWQSGSVTAYDGTTKVATVTFPSGFVTPTGTLTFKMWGVAPATSSGGGATAAEVWTYGTRTLTAATNITSTGSTIALDGSGRPGVNWGNVGSPTTTVTLSGTTIGTATALGTDAVNSTSLATSAVTELQTGLATAAAVATLDGKIDTVDSVVDAIKVKTDQLTFGVTNTLNVNVEYQNTAQICGNGTTGDKWRACP